MSTGLPALNALTRIVRAVFTRCGEHDWMQTYSGVQYFPACPSPEDVRIVDIAHHLSMLCRFTGAVNRFYSVAEHSVHVSFLVPPEHALWGLLHDASEAYLNDINRPLKRSLPDYKRIERRNHIAIARKFGLPETMPGEVKEADNAICQTERLALLLPNVQPNVQPAWQYLGEAADVEIQCWSPKEAEEQFLSRYYDLSRGWAEHVTNRFLARVLPLGLGLATA